MDLGYGTSDVLAGNLIGLNATGTAPLYPDSSDVSVGGDDNTIGGMSPNDRNVITGCIQHHQRIVEVPAPGF